MLHGRPRRAAGDFKEHVANEWRRQRRTAYPSGRKELIGYEKPDVGQTKRKVLNRDDSMIARLPMRGRFRQRIY